MVALPSVIGAFVFDTGVWKRANAGTPEAFSGPQVNPNGTAYVNCTNLAAYDAGFWRTTWVNITLELAMPASNASDFDTSPYTLLAYVWYQTDGSIDRNSNGVFTANWQNWRGYDCGRTIEIRAKTPTSGTYVTAEPTPLNTWLAMTTGNGEFRAEDTGTGFLFWGTQWDVDMRDSVAAPAAGNKSTTVLLNLTAEN